MAREAFIEFIKKVTSDVGSIKCKSEIGEELLTHLEDTFERNMATGMPETEAEEKALSAMGKTEELSKSFAALYPIHPQSYMNRAMHCMIWGLLLSQWRLRFLPYLDTILVVLGYILLGFGLLKLWRQNKKLQTAFCLLCGGVLFTSAGIFLRWWFIPGEKFYYGADIVSFLGQVFSGLSILFLLCGIQTETSALQQKGEKEPHLHLATVVMAIQILVVFLLRLPLFGEGKAEIQLGPILSIPFFCVPLLLLWSLLRAKKILTHKEPEPEILTPLKGSGKQLYAASVLCILLCGFVMMPLAASRQPKVKAFSPHDLPPAYAEDVKAAKENMIRLGFPQEKLPDLPDSEILKYKDAQAMYVHWLAAPYNYGAGYGPDSSEIPQGYYFVLPDPGNPDSNARLTRVLFCLKDIEERERPLRRGFYASDAPYDAEMAFLPTNPETTDSLAYTLSEANGKTLYGNAFAQYPKGESYEHLWGMEYNYPKQTENRRAYYAFTAGMHNGFKKSPNAFGDVLMYMEIFSKSKPLYVTYNNTLERYRSEEPYAYENTYFYKHSSYRLCLPQEQNTPPEEIPES